MTPIKIRPMFNIKYATMLLCLELPYVKSFPLSQEEGITGAQNLNREHLHISVGVMPRQSEMHT